MQLLNLLIDSVAIKLFYQFISLQKFENVDYVLVNTFYYSMKITLT